MPSVVPDVAIVSYQTADYLFNLLESLAPLVKSGSINHVHVWDNASADATPDLLARYTASHAWLTARLSSTNVHHGPALDALVRDACRTEWVFVLDADTEVRAPFAGAIDRLDLRDCAFVGQIHPQRRHLYAYLAHLLIHRERYLELPSFRRDGAPGVDYFAAVEQWRRPYRRFRWCDFIRHFGQSSLRRVAAANERTHELYAFARAQVEATPASPSRQRHEDLMSARLRAFLSVGPAPSPLSSVTHTDGREAIRATAVPPDRRWADEAAVWFRAPFRARALQAARRLGLRLPASEVEQLLTILERQPPKRVLEIGTGHGGALRLWAHAAAADALLVSVDWPLWEMDDPAEHDKLASMAVVRQRSQSVHLLRGHATHQDVRRQALTYFGGQPLDFLFLSANGPDDEVAAAAPPFIDAVRDGGIVAVADIHAPEGNWGGEMPRLWRELRERGRHRELVAETPGGYGIGVLWKGARDERT